MQKIFLSKDVSKYSRNSREKYRKIAQELFHIGLSCAMKTS